MNASPDPAPSLFDAYSQTYDEAERKSIGFMGQSHDYFTAFKADCIVDLLRRHLGDPANLRVLDIGCGVGKTDRFLAGRLGALAGVDISPASIERARADNPGVPYHVYDGRRLPYADGSFNAAFLICVLHHVEPESRVSLLREAARVVRPGGRLLVFEHNPWNPLTRLAVARCEFDRDARLLSKRETVRLLNLAGLPVVEQRYILVSPYRVPGAATLERLFRSLPLGAQYVVAGQTPDTSGGLESR